MIRMRTAAATAMLVAAGAMFVAGPYMVYRGIDAKRLVRAELVGQRIVTPKDARLPNRPVVDATTAQAQADVIEKHIFEATGGKTYAELELDDPARQIAFAGSMLRGALLSSVLAWNVANLVIGLGVLVAVLGFGFLVIGLLVRRPDRLLVAPAPDPLDEAVPTG